MLFDKTLVLNQVFALTLFVQAGDETTLLEKANWFCCEDAEKVRTFLEGHAPSLVNKLPISRFSAGLLAETAAYAAH